MNLYTTQKVNRFLKLIYYRPRKAVFYHIMRQPRKHRKSGKTRPLRTIRRCRHQFQLMLQLDTPPAPMEKFKKEKSEQNLRFNMELKRHLVVENATLRPTTCVRGPIAKEVRNPDTNKASGVVATEVAPNCRLS